MVEYNQTLGIAIFFLSNKSQYMRMTFYHSDENQLCLCTLTNLLTPNKSQYVDILYPSKVITFLFREWRREAEVAYEAMRTWKFRPREHKNRTEKMMMHQEQLTNLIEKIIPKRSNLQRMWTFVV